MKYILTFLLLIAPFGAVAQDATTSPEHAPPFVMHDLVDVQIGDTAPDFTLPDSNGEYRTLSQYLRKGPVILSFYRGGWCPYCNDQLYAYQQILPEFQELGAELVAISPEQAKSAHETVIKGELEFEVLSDFGNKVARSYDLIWTVPVDKRAGMSEWLKKETGKSLADFNGLGNYELPVPATYVIAQDGTVVYVFKDEDYKQRAKTEDILQALENLHKAAAE